MDGVGSLQSGVWGSPWGKQESVSPAREAEHSSRIGLKGVLLGLLALTAGSEYMQAWENDGGDSCLSGLVAGAVGSVFAESPLPMLIGAAGCFPGIKAQQRVGGEFQVNTYTNGDQEIPSVVSLNNGNFVVTWQSNGQDGSGYEVYGQIFDGSFNRLGPEFRVNTYISNNQWTPHIMSFTSGNFLATWKSNGQDGSGDGVHGQLFDVNANKIGNEFRINTRTIDHQQIPSAAGLSNGDFVVIWTSWNQDGSESGVYGQLFNGNANRIGNEFQVNTYVTGRQGYPSVASLSNGSFVVAWQSQYQDGSYGVYGQLFYGNGARGGNEFQINTYTNNTQNQISVAGFLNGGFVTIWESLWQDGSDFGVYGQLFDGNANRIGNEFQVNMYTNSTQAWPSIASFSNDNFVAAWHSNGQDGSSYGIYGKLFDSNANRIGNEFQVNTHVNNTQWFPTVATFSNDNFVVVWGSEGQDGSGYGIYGQLYEGPIISSTASSSSTISSSTSNPPASSIDSSTYIITSIDSTIVRSSTILGMSSSTSVLTISSPISESISSSGLITTFVFGTKNPEITSSGGSNSNVGFIVGIIAAFGVGCALGALSHYLHLNKKKAKESEDIMLESSESEEEQYANYSSEKKRDVQYANAPKGAQEEEYANFPIGKDKT